MKDLNVGDHLGSYRLCRKLGEGGMGMVFEAVHKEIERRVAIKVLRPEIAQNQQILARLFNEARAVNLIDHPGAVQIHDCVSSMDGAPAYLVMEYLHGTTLGIRLAESGGLQPERDVLRIAREIADLLSAAHRKRIVHRDLKPENIMLVPDPAVTSGERVKVLDFGIAKLGEVGTVRTGTNLIMGTPRYMSPEQCLGAGRVDDKTDVYALGVMMFQMLSGFLPFNAASQGELLYQHMKVPPPELLSIASGITRETAELVMSMLEKQKENRPAMSDVAASLDDIGARAGAPLRAPRMPQVAGGGGALVLAPEEGGSPVRSAPPLPSKEWDQSPRRSLLRRRWMQVLLAGAGVAALAVPLQAGLALQTASSIVSASSSVTDPVTSGRVVKAGRRPSRSAPIELLHNAPATVQVSSSTRQTSLSARALVDGDLLTAWNSRPGDLVGASVRFTVPEYARVQTLQLTAGFTKVGDKGDLFTMNHRITRVALFRDGALVGQFDLDPDKRELQEIQVNQPGGRFELQVAEVIPGTRSSWREICISELLVWGWLPADHPPVKQEPVVGDLPAQNLLQHNEESSRS